MEDAGRRAPVSLEASSCPFCDDWSVALQTKDKSKTQDIEGKSVLVCTSQFKRHVAAHLEQLAIFAIPCAKEDNTADERSSINSLGSTIANLSELGVQEEPQTSGEEWLEGRLPDDEDLPNTDEEQHNALLKTLDYLKIISEASSNGNFEKVRFVPIRRLFKTQTNASQLTQPPPTEALDQGIIPPILKEPTPPPLSDLEKEHWNKDLVEL